MRRAFDLHGWHQYDSHRRWLHLQELWHAITVAPGYQQGWPKWLATNAHVCVYSAQCPDVTQLEILLTVARDDANAVVNMAKKARRRPAKPPVTMMSKLVASVSTSVPSKVNLYHR